MRVVVTGGAGRLGRALAPLLVASGHSVKTCDAAAAPADHPCEHVVGDLRDLDAVRAGLAGAEVVIHSGALAGDNPAHPERVLAVNVQGTWNVMIASVEHGVRRVVALSSVNALGCFGALVPIRQMPIDDAYPRHPPRPYGLSKHLGEEVCRSFTALHDITTVCLRPALIVEPRRYDGWRADPDRMEAALRHDYWAYVDERDVCDAVLAGMVAQGVTHDAFLLTAADTCASRTTPELLAEHYPDAPWPDVAMPDYFAADPYRSVVDCSHAADVLGWRARRSWRTAPGD